MTELLGKEGEIFEGYAKVYENEFEAIKGIENEVKKGDVIVIKNSGPKGGPRGDEKINFINRISRTYPYFPFIVRRFF